MAAINRGVLRVAAAALALGLGACGNEPSAPKADARAAEALAGDFERLSREAYQAGDSGRGLALSGAAAAAQFGVQPTRIRVLNNGAAETYDALGLSYSTELRAASGSGTITVTYRTLVAWRGSGTARQLLVVGSPSASARVTNPFAGGLGSGLEVLRFAYAAYLDGASNTTWVGTGGSAGLAELAAGGKCPTSLNLPAGVPGVPVVSSCVLAVYSVVFDARLSPLGRDRRSVDPAVTRSLVAAAQRVNGAKLTFSCAGGGGCGRR